jgi:hypothetical protein
VRGRFVIDSVGMLRRLAGWPRWQGAPTPVYAMTETRLPSAKTARFIEFLKAHLAA